MLRCVDATPLVVTYTFITQEKDSDIDADSIGVKQASAVVEAVYIGSHGGDLLCIEAFSGNIIWKVQILGLQHFESSPAITTVTLDENETGPGDDQCRNVDPPILIACSFYGKDIDGPREQEQEQGEEGKDQGEGEDMAIGNIWALNALNGTLVWNAKTNYEVFYMMYFFN